LLFTGKESIGKKLLALEFAKGLLCSKGEPFGCGECKSCKLVGEFIAALRAGQEDKFAYYAEDESGKKHFAYLIGDHPDLAVVVPDGRAVKIDQIREIKQFVALKPTGRYKVVIIDDADTMTPQAQNALLKTLEEPPSDTVFILISRSKSALLPTIVSRCRVLEFKPLKPAEVRAVVSQLNVEIPEGLLHFMEKDGSLRMLKIDNDSFSELWALLTDEEKFGRWKYRDIIKAGELFEELSHEERETLLRIFSTYAVDKILEKTAKEKTEKQPTLPVYTVEEILRGLKRGLKAKLAMEYLLLTLREK
jgi:DNA polymerase-3 subunit delta'